jgi:possible homing endonuclease|nr:MAG TPA: endonuclease-like protein [Caudoviricetes sp.]
MATKIDQNEFVRRAKATHGEKYDLTKSVYRSYNMPVGVGCPKHGMFSVRASHFLNGVGCPKCAHAATGKALQLTKEEFIKRLVAIFGDKYDYSLVEYGGYKVPVKLVCPEHGVFEKQAGMLLAGKGCKQCGIKRRAEKRKGVSIPSKIPVDVRGSSFIQKAEKLHNGKYDYSKVSYATSQQPVDIICPKHGKFQQTPNNHLQGKGCIKCTCNTISRVEQSLKEAFPQFKQSDRVQLSGLELDLYEPNKRVAVEVNGVHWHTTEFGKTRNYHLHKTELCESQGITLLHFWDSEVTEQKRLVESMIAAKLGISGAKIYARNTTIREVSSEVTSEFLKDNHLQGVVPSSVRLGLYYNEELVSIMTFAKSRYTKQYHWELMRFCNKLGFHVVGGASKLLAAFRKTHAGSIVSYANRRFSKGGLYEKLGFVRIGASTPNYWYVKNGTICYSRTQCQKHKLKSLLGDSFDETLSEVVNMRNSGYYQLFDCGNYVYALE